MPTVETAFGLRLYFWSNEGDPLEPVHIHVAKETQGGAKFWILSDGSIKLEESTKGYLTAKDLKRATHLVEDFSDEICESWLETFGEINYIDQIEIEKEK